MVTRRILKLMMLGACGLALAALAAAGEWASPRGHVIVEGLESQGASGQLAGLAAVGPETPRGSFKPGRVAYSVRSAEPGQSKVVVDVYAEPGLPAEDICAMMLKQETTTTHHDLIIFEGGKNNALAAGSLTAELAEAYRAVLRKVALRAGVVEAPLLLDNVTPVIPEVLTQRGYDGPRYQANIEILNGVQTELADSWGFGVIRHYALFKSHYTLDAASWCRNEVNGGMLDGSHLSALGAQALGRAYWEALKPFVVARYGHLPLRVGIHGDSIAACLYLPEAQRPAAWLVYYASLNGAPDWKHYQ